MLTIQCNNFGISFSSFLLRRDQTLGQAPVRTWDRDGNWDDREWHAEELAVEDSESIDDVVETEDHLCLDMPQQFDQFPMRLPEFSLTTKELTNAYGLGLRRLPRLLVKDIDMFSTWSTEPMNLTREPK